MRRVWALTAAAIGILALLVVVGLPLYVFPAAGEPRPSEAVLVLGPPTEQRVALAEELRDEGLAERIVVSVQRSGGQTEKYLSVCGAPGVTCGIPEPFTTRGELLLLRDQATALGPPSVIVVTFTPHVTRTRYIFGKCYGGEFTVVATDEQLSPAGWAYQYVYQSLAFVKALFEPCP